jgi:hypothetical protein
MDLEADDQRVTDVRCQGEQGLGQGTSSASVHPASNTPIQAEGAERRGSQNGAAGHWQWMVRSLAGLRAGFGDQVDLPGGKLEETPAGAIQDVFPAGGDPVNCNALSAQNLAGDVEARPTAGPEPSSSAAVKVAS